MIEMQVDVAGTGIWFGVCVSWLFSPSRVWQFSALNVRMIICRGVFESPELTL